MEAINPSDEILENLDGSAILRKLEMCGRVCYKSEGNITDDSAEKFIRNIIKRGHESVLEHFSFSVRFITDRGISHEIVRHRIASYSQESTRYCNYGRNNIQFVVPSGIEGSFPQWEHSCIQAEKVYKDLIAGGISPQVARSVLPTCLKTEIIMSANLREWRWFFAKRTAQDSHPDIRKLTVPLLKELQEKIPVIFEDFEVADRDYTILKR